MNMKDAYPSNLAPHELFTGSSAIRSAVPTINGMDQDTSGNWLTEQLAACSGPGAHRAGALSVLEELAPSTPLEGMLVTQMVGCHLEAMDQLRKAAQSSSAEKADRHLRQAQQLQRLFLSQVDGLERLRGRRHQQVRVEHVHVYEGAQAVVGTIHAGGESRG